MSRFDIVGLVGVMMVVASAFWLLVGGLLTIAYHSSWALASLVVIYAATALIGILIVQVGSTNKILDALESEDNASR